MSYSPEPPWSASEKDALLASVVRNLGVDLTAVLLRVITEQREGPRWEDIPLPTGRTVRSSRHAFEEMLNQRTHLPPAPQYQMYHQQPLYQLQPQLSSAIPRKRSFEPEAPPPGPRTLQPRPPSSTDSPIPPVTNGESFIITRQSQEASSEPAKKRGRPSKEDVKKREKELAAKGEVYKPTKRKPKKPETPAGSPLPPLTLPEPGATAAPVIETPLRQTFDGREETSSGKRRRRKPRDEGQGLENAPTSTFPTAEPVAAYPTVPAQSPSDRLLARGADRDSVPANMSRELDQSEQSGDVQELPTTGEE